MIYILWCIAKLSDFVGSGFTYMIQHNWHLIFLNVMCYVGNIFSFLLNTIFLQSNALWSGTDYSWWHCCQTSNKICTLEGTVKNGTGTGHFVIGQGFSLFAYLTDKAIWSNKMVVHAAESRFGGPRLTMQWMIMAAFMDNCQLVGFSTVFCFWS